MSKYKMLLPWMRKKDLYVGIVVAVVLFFVSIIFSFVKEADIKCVPNFPKSLSFYPYLER